MPLFIFYPERDSKDSIAICRWHIAATSSKTGGYNYFCPLRGKNANESLSASFKIRKSVGTTAPFEKSYKNIRTKEE